MNRPRYDFALRYYIRAQPIAQALRCDYNRGMTKRVWNLFLVVVALLGGAWIQFARVPTETDLATVTAAHVNFRAPDFALKTWDGKSVALSNYRGKVVLINFWATWCPPCRSEMPEIQSAAQANPDKLVVLAIDYMETPDLVKPFVEELGLQFPILLDSDGAVARQYNVQGLPTSFFIDPTGIVRVTNVGGVNRAYIEAQIEVLAK